MDKNENNSVQEQMASGKISSLLIKFCVPALASNLVTAVYNIVDQLFIGNDIGALGNAATNVVFPAVTLLTAFSLMTGVGTSAVMNISLGRGDESRAKKAVGSGFSLMVILGLALTLLLLVFTKPVLYLFGCTDEIWTYAERYARIIAVGFTLSILGTAGPFVIRADGASGYALMSIASGAVLNIGLDALFVVGFGWSIEGAAWATVLSQAVSAGLVTQYMRKKFKAFPMTAADYRPDGNVMEQIAKLGAGPAVNFGTQSLVAVILNNALRTYGAQSVYGSAAALAAAGVANKVNTLIVAVFTGLANGMQPIISFNYGRKNYKRVAKIGLTIITSMILVGFMVFAVYQLFPVQITKLFGEGSEEYYEFAARYFRTYLFLIPFTGLITAVGGFFSAQGKPMQSVLLSVSKQLILSPLLLSFLPLLLGLDGVLISGPIADGLLAVLAFTLLFREVKKLNRASSPSDPRESGESLETAQGKGKNGK